MVSSRENYDPYASYATPTMTNQIQLDVYDSASQKAQQFGQEGDGLQGEGGSSILYEYDLVMIFPLREGGESKKPHQFGIEAFVSLMMGMDLEKSRKKDKIVIDTLHRVLRTPRCYLDDHGNENFTKDHHYGDQSEQAYLHIQKDLLEKEYEAFVGHRDITSELQFCELIATSISRRVQLACGLTTRMFRSCDNDEVYIYIFSFL
jgi:anoctamin-10